MVGSTNNAVERTAIHRAGFREDVKGVAQKLVVTRMMKQADKLMMR
jgi:hypothetical protein